MSTRLCASLLLSLTLSWGCFVAPAQSPHTGPIPHAQRSAGPPGSTAPAPPNAPLPSRSTSDKVTIAVTENQYDIRGLYAADLRHEMNQLGPLDREGVRHDAYTGWFIDWKYPYAQTTSGCSTGPVRVTVSVTYTMPRWNAPPHASVALRKRWAQYTENLRTHEDVHRDIGVHAGEEIKRRMEALPPKTTCGALEVAADAVGKRLLEKYRLMERAYDRDTGHGATQGASFP